MTDFDQVGGEFISYYETVRGHVREALVQRNLAPYLPPLPARVIDVGGGVMVVMPPGSPVAVMT